MHQTLPAKSEQTLAAQVDAMYDTAEPIVTGLANVAAVLYQQLPNISWVGFYFYDTTRDALVLGPFIGKPACTILPMDQGVCAAAARTKQVVLVDDVSTFEGHIACDSDSKSELVVPIVSASYGLLGVLDLDAPIVNRFTQADAAELGQAAEILAARLTTSLEHTTGRLFV